MTNLVDGDDACFVVDQVHETIIALSNAKAVGVARQLF
jgi:hypothetical protein